MRRELKLMPKSIELTAEVSSGAWRGGECGLVEVGGLERGTGAPSNGHVVVRDQRRQMAGERDRGVLVGHAFVETLEIEPDL